MTEIGEIKSPLVLFPSRVVTYYNLACLEDPVSLLNLTYSMWRYPRLKLARIKWGGVGHQKELSQLLEANRGEIAILLVLLSVPKRLPVDLIREFHNLFIHVS